MSRILPLLLCGGLLLITLSALAQKECADAGYREQLLAADRHISQKLEAIENFIQSTTSSSSTIISRSGSHFSLPDVITIPVVIHIVYNTDAQNISDALIQSQLDALNNDFRKQNADQVHIPSYFTDMAADCGFEFKLARTDPKGFATTGVIRRKTNIQNFGTDDRVKYTSRGGDDAWDASRYLNIWICNLTGGILGYSSMMGCDTKIDGVVIYTGVFGVNPASGSSFNKGRTATHEIGHWLHLKHIWGDNYCGDDKVDDTPAQRSPNRGCPSGQHFTCGSTANGDMYMNYMDLTNDACMQMFTYGQRQRMRALFMPGGPRNSILSSNALSAPAAAAPVLEEGAMPVAVLQVFPNPARTFITVQYAGAGTTLIVYNHLGQPVVNVTAQAGQTTIDISHLANGMYYLRTTDGMNKTVKFIKAG